MMESVTTIQNIPLEIFDLICNFLSMFDIVKLEQTSKTVKDRIEQSLIWKKEADRFQRRFKFKLTEKIILELKKKNLCNTANSKFYKIIIGISGHLRKAMKLLESKENKLSEDVKKEVDTYVSNFDESAQLLPVHQWIRKVLKLFLEIELVKKKKIQILTFQDTFQVQKEEEDPASESIDVEMIETSKINDLLEQPDPNVNEEIVKFGSWTESKIQPTENEIMLIAKSKASSIMNKLQQRFIEAGGGAEDA